MKRLRHPNIIQFIDVFETSEQLLLVLEYAPGKELFDVILAKKSLPEPYARSIFAQVSQISYQFYQQFMNIVYYYVIIYTLFSFFPTRSLERCTTFTV